MNKTIPPGARRGAVTIPPSKSDAHRALICAALANTPTHIVMDGESGDIAATLRCLEALGTKLGKTPRGIMVTPRKNRRTSPLLDCGESGSTLRFLLPAAPFLAESPRFNGSGRLPERPVGELLNALSENGCAADSPKIPLTLSGIPRAGEYALRGDISSQFISGLLMALPAADGDSVLRLTSPLESGAYVDMTVNTALRFGAQISRSELGYSVSGGGLSSPGEYTVERDWSGASFFVALSSLGGQVEIEGLDAACAQPDKAIAALAADLPDTVDVSAFPDLFPVLAILACGLKRETRLVGAPRLRLKESDRIMSTARLITNLGGRCEERPGSLTIFGSGRLRGGMADSANDHRIAMSAAVAAAICDEPVTILGAEAVKKSFPCFWEEFDKLIIM